MSQEYNISTLSNGLRIVTAPASGPVSYIGVAVNAGSRDEDTARQGLAHFVEHTIFKGTDRRRSWQISSRMETIGGELNAYTSKEETLVYTSVSAGYTERAFDLLGDIIANSRFPGIEIDKERDVVIEEIHSYQDSPADSVFDEFEELLYAGSGLAHNILGNPDSVRTISSADCRRFLDDFYTPDNMVVYCVDNSPLPRILCLAERYFGDMHLRCRPHRRTPPPDNKPFSIVRDRGNHQANTVMGTRMLHRNDPRRFALFLLNNHLGGPCMNSRLNRELRERRGWVYTVDSTVGLLSDTGALFVYFGCDPGRVERCARIITNEIHALASRPPSPRALEAMKRQYCGQLLLTSDHKESRAMSLAKSVLYYGEVHDIASAADAIRSVTPGQFLEVARLLADTPLSRLTLV